METEIKFCPRCGAEIAPLTSGYVCPKCGWGEGGSNDIIEIPFGAHDSELKGWEYTIPEGMEAKIENGKIIVREKESEDERMLREISRYIKEQGDKPSGLPNGTVCVADMLAWLERQKERKPIDIDFVSDWLRKHITTYINSEYNEFHKTVEYDGSINIEHLIEDLKKAIEQHPFTRENDSISKPAEWSEEDGEMLENIIQDYECFNKESMLTPTYRYRLDWLKSLRFQHHWKPSEDQIQALYNILQDPKKAGSISDRASIVGLINDLEKLM